MTTRDGQYPGNGEIRRLRLERPPPRRRRRPHRGRRGAAAGHGLRPHRRRRSAHRPLHRRRHDRGRRRLRLLVPPHQRPDQRHFPRRFQRHRRPGTARRRRIRARLAGGVPPQPARGRLSDRHRPVPAGRPDALRLGVGHPRFHGRGRPARGSGSSPQSARRQADGRRPSDPHCAAVGNADGRQRGELDFRRPRNGNGPGGDRPAPAGNPPQDPVAGHAHRRHPGGAGRLAIRPGRSGQGDGRAARLVPHLRSAGRLRSQLGDAAERQRPGHRPARPAGGAGRGQVDRLPDARAARLQPPVPRRRPGQPRRRSVPVHARLRLADALGRQLPGRGRQPAVGDHLRRGRGRRPSAVRRTGQVRAQVGPGRSAHGDRVAAGGLEAAGLLPASHALRRRRLPHHGRGRRLHQRRILHPHRHLLLVPVLRPAPPVCRPANWSSARSAWCAEGSAATRSAANSCC